MPDYPHIEAYYAEKQRLIDFGGSSNELNIRRAFAACLDSYCRDHREKLALVEELKASGNVIPDGTVKDTLRMARGYWEAKDSRDNLDAEIQAKFNRGYPKDNIVFEDSVTAVLVQNGDVAMRVDMNRPGELHRLIRRFLDYELPNIEEFRKAQQQFKADLPSVLENLRRAVADAEANNPEYQAAADGFLALCKRTIGPWVTPNNVREMLLQHILTKDVFLRVFDEIQFHRENNIARQLDALEQTFFTGNVRREAIDRLRTYYGAIGRAADEIADYAEKQQFLKAIYEDFYQAYNPAAADRLGVVYTPNEVVDFIIRGTDYLLQKHFGKTLADDNVQILDPATGTGTFITNLINYLPIDRLEHKYLNEIHANEVAILPYYIANLNIEYTYKERMGQYLEFPNLCFVDTLDNMDWQGISGGSFTYQIGLNLGAISEENWMRLQGQNRQTISVIIGNPPYNDSATLWGDNTANDPYPDIDLRIKETYVAAGTAQKTHQYDMYKRFIRWASDRLADDGILAFITNRSYIDARQDDGFRKVVLDEFNDLYIVDMGGDIRKSGRVGNVFGIMTGVAVGFLVRNAKERVRGQVHYRALPDRLAAADKLALLRSLEPENIGFTAIAPDTQHNWLNQAISGFGDLLALSPKDSKFRKSDLSDTAVFGLYTNAIKSNRDNWVYDFDVANLRAKILFFANTYNAFLEAGDISYDPVIKWSHSLRDRFQRGERIIYDDALRVASLWRPFVTKQYMANDGLNDRLTSNHYQMFGRSLKQFNWVINVCINSKEFYIMASDKIVDYHFVGDTQCLPLYRYTGNGERVSNITEWGLRQFREHYGDDGITAEDIFAYTYAVLHDPVYRHDYQVDLLREFPRLPFYSQFHHWRQMGQELLDLHIGFESVEPYPLERVDSAAELGRPRLGADKAQGIIVLDGQTALRGVPPQAWEYRLGSRSALEWVLDQYKERKPRDPTIAELFNTYRFADHKERVIDLLGRVCAVSVKTMDVVDDMAYWADGQLIVLGDRDKNEWSTLGLQAMFNRHEEQDENWEEQWSET